MPFHATNKPGTCLWCGYKLPNYQFGEGRGYQGNNFFCTAGCGFAFAVRMAELGHRFKAMDTDPPEKVRAKPVKTPKCAECKKPMKKHDGEYGQFHYVQCETLGCSEIRDPKPVVLNEDKTAWVLKATSQ